MSILHWRLVINSTMPICDLPNASIRPVYAANGNQRGASVAMGDGREEVTLKRYYNIDDYTWLRICKFYSFTCQDCKVIFSPEKLTVDHVKPLSKGGTNSVRNYQPLCLDCNKKKGVKTIDYRWDKGKELLKYLIDGPLINQSSFEELGNNSTEHHVITIDDLQPFVEAINILAETITDQRETIKELTVRVSSLEKDSHLKRHNYDRLYPN